MALPKHWGLFRRSMYQTCKIVLLNTGSRGGWGSGRCQSFQSSSAFTPKKDLLTRCSRKGPSAEEGRAGAGPRLLRRAAVLLPPVGVRPAPAARESGRAALQAARGERAAATPSQPPAPARLPGACCQRQRQRRFRKLVPCLFPDRVNCCRTSLHHPAPGAGGVVSSMCWTHSHQWLRD